MHTYLNFTPALDVITRNRVGKKLPFSFSPSVCLILAAVSHVFLVSLALLLLYFMVSLWHTPTHPIVSHCSFFPLFCLPPNPARLYNRLFLITPYINEISISTSPSSMCVVCFFLFLFCFKITKEATVCFFATLCQTSLRRAVCSDGWSGLLG